MKSSPLSVHIHINLIGAYRHARYWFKIKINPMTEPLPHLEIVADQVINLKSEKGVNLTKT